MKNKLQFVSFGVYGSDEDSFFQALIQAGIGTFLDLRQRRGMRGKKYAFVNSQRLQDKLNSMGIRYRHIKALAPTKDIRVIQKQADQMSSSQKRSRTGLSSEFIQAYEEQVLSNYDFASLIDQLSDESKNVGLFCVEREPNACHRSIVSGWLQSNYGLEVEELFP